MPFRYHQRVCPACEQPRYVKLQTGELSSSHFTCLTYVTATSKIFQSGCILPKLIIYKIYYKMLFLTISGNHVFFNFRNKRENTMLFHRNNTMLLGQTQPNFFSSVNAGGSLCSFFSLRWDHNGLNW